MTFVIDIFALSGPSNRAAGGELQRVVDLQDGLQEVETVQVMRQILEGLIFLHDHNIAHLDLKVRSVE